VLCISASLLISKLLKLSFQLINDPDKISEKKYFQIYQQAAG
jgi:hypothetical protein